MPSLASLHPTAEAIERYVDAHLFDPQGLLYAYIDGVTGKPIAPELLPARIVPRRAAADPWAYWTYEDTMESCGMYVEGMSRRFALTGEKEAFLKASRVWSTVRFTYSCSQAYGIGSFLRPYGGYEGMARFVEPLGTDQIGPVFHGAAQYMKHVPPAWLPEMRDMLLQSLIWHERQGFQYFYYKAFIHEWTAQLQHAASYYLPAIAWAAGFTGESRWQGYLQKYLGRMEKGPVPLAESYARHNLYRSFYWGGDLPVLRECLGERWGEFVTPAMLDHAFALCEGDLAATYTEPGTLKRYHPESAEPGFKPHVQRDYDPGKGIGFIYYAAVHQGRSRPRLELNFLCGLAAVGHRGAFERALELLSHRRGVPTDFTDFLFEDHAALPEEVHWFARAVGTLLHEWYRNYWMLRGAAMEHGWMG